MDVFPFMYDFTTIKSPKREPEKPKKICSLEEFVTEAVEDEINLCTTAFSKALLAENKDAIISYLKKEYFNVPAGQFVAHVCQFMNLNPALVDSFKKMFAFLEKIAAKMEEDREYIKTPEKQREIDEHFDKVARRQAAKENSPEPPPQPQRQRLIAHDPRPCPNKYQPPKSMFEVDEPSISPKSVNSSAANAGHDGSVGSSNVMPQNDKRAPAAVAYNGERLSSPADISPSPPLAAVAPPLRSALKRQSNASTTSSSVYVSSSPVEQYRVNGSFAGDSSPSAPGTTVRARSADYYFQRMASTNTSFNAAASSSVNLVTRKESVKKPPLFSRSDSMPTTSNAGRYSMIESSNKSRSMFDAMSDDDFYSEEEEQEPVNNPPRSSRSNTLPTTCNAGRRSASNSNNDVHKPRSMFDVSSGDEDELPQQQLVTKKRRIGFHSDVVDNEFTPRPAEYIEEHLTLSVPLNEHRAVDVKYTTNIVTCSEVLAALPNQPCAVKAPVQCVYESWYPSLDDKNVKSMNDFEEEITEILGKFRYNSFNAKRDGPKRPLHLVIKDSLLFPTNFRQKYRECWEIDAKYPHKMAAITEVLEDEIAQQRNDYLIKTVIFSLGFDLVLREPNIESALKIMQLYLKNFIAALRTAFDRQGPKRYRRYAEEKEDDVGRNAPFVPEIPKLVILTIPFLAAHPTAATYSYQIAQMNDFLRRYVEEYKAKLFKNYGQVIELYDWQKESQQYGELSPAHVEARFKVLTTSLCQRYQMFTFKNVAEEDLEPIFE